LKGLNILLIFSLVFTLMTVSCGMLEKILPTPTPIPSPTPIPPTPTPTGPQPYPDLVRQLFTDFCSELQSNEFCECGISQIEQNILLEDFMKLGLTALDPNSGEIGGDLMKILPPEFIGILTPCMQYIQLPDSADTESGEEVEEKTPEEIINNILGDSPNGPALLPIVEQCIPQAGTKFCECSLEQLVNNYSDEEISSMIADGSLEQKIQGLAAGCFQYFSPGQSDATPKEKPEETNTENSTNDEPEETTKPKSTLESINDLMKMNQMELMGVLTPDNPLTPLMLASNTCVQESATLMGESEAKKYCSCGIENFAEKYPTLDDVSSLTTSDRLTELESSIASCPLPTTQ
jgi:hypothetical protein